MRAAVILLSLGGALPVCSAPPRPCTPVPPASGPTIVVRRVGGNIRPTAIAIFADGSVRAADTSSAAMRVAIPQSVSASEVASIGSAAHTGAFWNLPTSPTHEPTQPADEARRSITVNLTCGSHTTTYPENAEPAAFRALVERIDALLGLTPTKP
jgi:hypothetical protein